MKSERLNAKSLGISFAVYGAISMLLLSILGLFDLFGSAVEMMEVFHIGYSLSFVGIIIGIAEAAAFCFLSGLLIAFVYNKVN